MGWNWVNDLLTPEGKKKNFNWDARCPYYLCPGNHPIERKPKLKFIQKVSPLIYQYRCGYCSCLTNISVEVPDDRGGMKGLNPLMYVGKK